MNRAYWLFIALLCVSLVAISWVRSAPSAKTADPKTAPVVLPLQSNDPTFIDSAFTTQLKILKHIGKRRKALLIGDSMFEGLCGPLNDYLEHAGFETTTIVWYGAYSKVWCRHDTLKTILELNKPDFVMFSCGTNELLIPYIRVHQPYVSKLTEVLNGYHFAWIGPPNWKKDTGINHLIDSTLNGNHFYYSGNLQLSRYKDGIHPDKAGNRIWADSIVTWVNANYSDYLYLSRPDTFKYRVKNYHIIPTSYLFSSN